MNPIGGANRGPASNLSHLLQKYSGVSTSFYSIYIRYNDYMTTVAVTEEVKRRLLRVASELQLKLRRKVDLNEAISYLLTREKRRPDLLDAASRPIPGFEEAKESAYRSRGRMKSRLAGRF